MILAQYKPNINKTIILSKIMNKTAGPKTTSLHSISTFFFRRA